MFHLCLAGLASHPDHLETVLTGNQLAEWEEFNRLEPVGSYQQDFLFAQLCNLIYILAHAFGGKETGSKIQDFMPWWSTQYLKVAGRTKQRKQLVEEMKRNFLEWARQHNRALEKKIKKEG